MWFQENINKRLINWDWMPLVNNCTPPCLNPFVTMLHSPSNYLFFTYWRLITELMFNYMLIKRKAKLYISTEIRYGQAGFWITQKHLMSFSHFGGYPLLDSVLLAILDAFVYLLLFYAYYFMVLNRSWTLVYLVSLWEKIGELSE